MKIPSLLRETGRVLRTEGYAFLVVGESALKLYESRDQADFLVWTNADPLHLARVCGFQFAAEPEAGASEGDAAAWPGGAGEGGAPLLCRREGVTLIAESDPLRHLSPEHLTLARLRPLAASRFFSVDALVCDPLGEKFYDPLGCRTDIKERRVRVLEAPATASVRHIPSLFRAVRMEAEESFVFDPSLDLVLKNACPPPADRAAVRAYRRGLSGALCGAAPGDSLKCLDRLGVLELLIPEIRDLKGCPQDKDFHPEGDVFTHTLECFRQVRRAPLTLALSILLHDIAKPVTLSIDKRALNFPGHSSCGARMAGGILARLGFPREVTEEVKFAIRHHLLPVVLRRLPPEDAEALVRNPWFPTVLRLYKEDVRGSGGDLVSYRSLVKSISPWLPDRIVASKEDA